jgi:hypothetical protein
MQPGAKPMTGNYKNHDPNRPGKFENEPAWVVKFYEEIMSGYVAHTYQDQETGQEFDVIEVLDEDEKEFPELAGYGLVMLWEDDNGFVYKTRYTDQEDLEEHNPHLLEM